MREKSRELVAEDEVKCEQSTSFSSTIGVWFYTILWMNASPERGFASGGRGQLARRRSTATNAFITVTHVRV